jgi:hypothetical protein
VTWVEELIGRRLSLRANAVVAVSSSGFTQGAWRKAEALGVILREFGNLTPEEIATWGKGTQVFLQYVRIGRVDLNLVVPVSLVHRVASSVLEFKKGDGDPWPIGELFKGFAEHLREIDRPHGVARLQIFTNDLYFLGRKIEEIVIQGQFERLEIPLLLPAVQVYGSPNETPRKREVAIEKIVDTDMEIIRTPKGAFLIFDLSVVEPIDNAYFQSVLFHNRDDLLILGFGVVGKREPHLDFRAFTVRTILKNGPAYKSLMPDEDGDTRIVLPE